jgi:hypothetical protein
MPIYTSSLVSRIQPCGSFQFRQDFGVGGPGRQKLVSIWRRLIDLNARIKDQPTPPYLQFLNGPPNRKMEAARRLAKG